MPTPDERLATIWIVSSLAWSAIPSATTDDPETSWLILVLNPQLSLKQLVGRGAAMCAHVRRASRGLTTYASLLIGHPGSCLDRRRERAKTACPCEGRKQTSPSRRR